MLIATQPPKFSKATLEPSPHMFIVQSGLMYDYYPVKASWLIPDVMIKIDQSPPVVSEGYLTFNRRLYKVSIEDLLRRKVHVRNIQQPDHSEANADSGERETVCREIRNQDKRATIDLLGVEISQAADVAWQEQIGALLRASDSEEGIWEVSDHP